MATKKFICKKCSFTTEKLEKLNTHTKKIHIIHNVGNVPVEKSKTTPSVQHSSQPPFSADDFLKFIEEKVSKVRDATAGFPPPVFTKTDAIFPGFELCSQVEFWEIIK